MNRDALRRSPVLSLLAAGAALALAGALGTLGGGESAAPPAPAGEAARAPVVRTSLVCPRPTAVEEAATYYTAYSPAGEGPAGDSRPGTASLLPITPYTPGTDEENPDEDEEATGEDTDATEATDDSGEQPGAEPVVESAEPGVPVAVNVKNDEATALAGTAEHRVAPGWTVQQSSIVDTSGARGLLGTACQAPAADFWFAGAATVDTRHDYLHLTNPEDGGTVVDIELYGPEGRLETGIAEDGVSLPGRSGVAVRLSTLTDEQHAGLAVHVTARTGRIGAQIETVDEQLGVDWLPAVTGGTDGRVLLPGIPADAKTVRLVAFTPGDADLNLSVQLVGATGTFTPAGNESLFLRSGLLEAVELADITQGEPGSLLLTPEDSLTGPVVASLRVTRGDGSKQEMAFIAGTAPVEERASVSGNVLDGTELSLVAPGETAEVRVTWSAASGGGDPVTEEITVPAGTTVAVTPELPEGAKGRYAATVERTGGGELYAARTLTVERDKIPMFTVQTLPDDRSRVTVPGTGENIGLLLPDD
ncbi:DUF5719 family protein [Streptomyces aidingensis]|uniref:Uncharacterized protein n=1 Tax=Streptomyces aidingensis TaxID=910347 RepID=A0A1I1GIA2_9ACTN|nr:DUF5719 family protein [Streptomyces aidingensis]SFC11509.1 hypothetical protein SAMN05421773_10211 [Streptomyces aidingensis]